MENRRNFLKKSALGTLGVSTVMSCSKSNKTSSKPVFPRIISTWNHGLDANKKAWEVLKNGQGGLSAVEEGVKVTEADPNVRSVGLGGYPDREGIVTLDACIMDKDSNCGSVSYLQNIKHPISVARHVMEDTPHVMLSGSGALDFAISKGFKQENLGRLEYSAAYVNLEINFLTNGNYKIIPPKEFKKFDRESSMFNFESIEVSSKDDLKKQITELGFEI